MAELSKEDMEKLLTESKKMAEGDIFDSLFTEMAGKFLSTVNEKGVQGMPAIFFIQYLDEGKLYVEACDGMPIFQIEDPKAQYDEVRNMGYQWLGDKKRPVITVYVAYPALSKGKDDVEFESCVFTGLSFIGSQATILFKTVKDGEKVKLEELARVLSKEAKDNLPKPQETLMSAFYRGYVEKAKEIEKETIH